MKSSRSACKPHSVRRETRLDGHLSGRVVTHPLERSTRRWLGYRRFPSVARLLSCLTLHRMGVACPVALLRPSVVSYTAVSPLLSRGRAVFFLWPCSKRLRTSGRYPACCPVVCGLSSGDCAPAAIRPTWTLIIRLMCWKCIYS